MGEVRISAIFQASTLEKICSPFLSSSFPTGLSFTIHDEQLYEREMMLEIARDLVTSARASFYMYPPLRA